MNKLIIILLICLFYKECDSRWKEILNENDFVEYVEVDTVKKINSIIYIWSMKNYKKPLPNGNLSIKYYGRYDCKKMKYQIISIIGYKTEMGKGRNFNYIKNENDLTDDSKWISPLQNSNDDKRLSFVCKI